MDFIELAGNRFTARNYNSNPVPGEYVDKILEAARIAPTAHNMQPQRIIVVDSPEGLAKLEKCTECRYNAPLAFVICYDKKQAWVREYDGKCSGDVDTAIVTTHMMLEAQSLGLNSTWIGFFIPEAISTEFLLTDDTVPVALLYVGYSDAKPSPAHFSRKDTEDFVTRLK